MCRNSSAGPRGMSGLAALASAMAVFSSGVAARLVSSFCGGGGGGGGE